MRRSFLLLTCAVLLSAGCIRGESAPGVELASDQTFNIAIAGDVQTLDPATVGQPGSEVNLVRNVFGGLYRYDDDLKIVADLADGMPQISADGRTWTFHIRAGALFSNGDPVRAQDVVFSWSRAASRGNDDALVFEPVAGFGAVQSGTATSLAGLAAPDGRTVVATLVDPAGWWLAELALWPAYVLDEKVVRQFGDNQWWKTLEGLVGTGPFRLTARSPSALDFAPVAPWWQGPTGNLKHVHVELVPRVDDQVRMFESGHLDVVGYNAPNTEPFISTAAIRRYLADPRLSREVVGHPWLKSEWLTFNVANGPLAGPSALKLRRALSRAINRARLTHDVCFDVFCIPADGGLIVRGLQGYLGNAADPNAVFDPAAARADLLAADPDGSRVRQLVLLSHSGFRTQAMEIAQQWKDNLGIEVPVSVQTPPAVGAARRSGNFSILVGGFLADYDSPYDWYHNSTFAIGNSYKNPAFDALLSSAATKLPADAGPLYDRAGKMLIDDAAYAALDYVRWNGLISQKVAGAGGNALYDYSWTKTSKLANTAPTRP